MHIKPVQKKYDITYRCLESIDVYILPEALPVHSLFRLRSLVWFVFQWKPLLFSTASQFGEMGAHSITRAQAPLSTLVFGG